MALRNSTQNLNPNVFTYSGNQQEGGTNKNNKRKSQQVKDDLCFKCGRKGHKKAQCYSKTKADGCIHYTLSCPKTAHQHCIPMGVAWKFRAKNFVEVEPCLFVPPCFQYQNNSIRARVGRLSQTLSRMGRRMRQLLTLNPAGWVLTGNVTPLASFSAYLLSEKFNSPANSKTIQLDMEFSANSSCTRVGYTAIVNDMQAQDQEREHEITLNHCVVEHTP